MVKSEFGREQQINSKSHISISENDWKLIYYHEDGRTELYHFATDPGEQQDLARTEPDRVKALRAKLNAWLKATGAKFPTMDSQFDPAKRAARWETLKTRGKLSLEQRHASYLDANYKPNKDWWGSAPKD